MTKSERNSEGLYMKKMPKPTILEDKHLQFLDKLRESGVTNMFGAVAYLERRFGITEKEATSILGYWMDTFSERHGPSRDND